jgi:hypothetical protein
LYPKLSLKPTEKARAVAAGLIKVPPPVVAAPPPPRPPVVASCPPVEPDQAFTAAHAALTELVGHEPRLPLARGALDEIVALGVDPDAARAALGALCHTEFYLHLLCRYGMHRWHIDGTNAGPVADADRRGAVWRRRHAAAQVSP